MAEESGQGQSSCPECGAQHKLGNSCREQFEAVLAWEWHDSALQGQHFLMVACYNLQHPAQFTDEALASLYSIFIDYFDNDAPVALLRRRVARLAQRSKIVRKEVAARREALRSWPMTVADVYHGGQPDGAAERVYQWALSVRSHLWPGA